MAECNVSRCSQERRLFRKELNKWSKEILYAIGLERLAEELMGTRAWKILVEPFTVLETNFPDDWCPEETCYICNAKKLPPYDPASGIIPVDGYSSLRIDTDDHSTSSDLGTAPGSSSCSSVSPWHLTPLISQTVSLSPTTLDQPLDLSFRASNEEYNSQINLIDANSVLKVPQIPLKSNLRKKVDGNSKRSYTEDELQAALRDIQSGKLGTRRAAVIYGIPRSTLRNKVYKLANESKSRVHCHVSHVSKIKMEDESFKKIKDSTPAMMECDSTKASASTNESLRQLLKDTITQKTLNSSILSNNKDLLMDESDENLEDDDQVHTLKSLECSQTIAPVLSCVFANIQNLALGRHKENLSNQSLSALRNDLKLPILPELIRRLLGERISLKKKYFGNIEGVKSDIGPSEVLPHVILKVPSFKVTPECNPLPELENPILSSNSAATSSHSISGNKGITVSLKELIAKSIIKKNTCSSDETSTDLYQNKLEDIKSWNIQESLREHVKEIRSLSQSENCKAEKRTRPKRGRYRNYDRDNLARAVRAVQKGEMSVHRAGTFFGVPHSTLEYKVKERHLLRPRKRENFNNPPYIEASDSGLETPFDVLPLYCNDSKGVHKQSKNADFNTDSEDIHCPAVDSLPSHLSLWQSLPFFSLDFQQLSSSNFFASQMMRKLQENARLNENEDVQKKIKSQELGILESLIKSTLDRPTTSKTKSNFAFPSDLPQASGKDIIED